MNYREATLADIPQMHEVRIAVTENRLSTPDRITFNDYREFLVERGKGWVCEQEGEVIGFSVIDMKMLNVWALFVTPTHERKGIGRKLHDMMLAWHFAHRTDPLWLGTSPGTRAENFYRQAGWTEAGNHGNDEIRFEMTHANWKAHTAQDSLIT
jgi:GNAT superfamily N-acetyltransferase